VELPLTPHHAEWSYYELINGKLDKQLQIHVEYAQAVREKVETIIIKIQK
jgi:hypothetical protein